ncbi:MAG: glycosyltransferase family 2 protein [Gammaproteobacteria bacterium]|nr:glycosyltransferase family 2 protein [Gammaproteobacteria bacterium]MBU1481739.1 glycosyltransferase family 2 protein [Gammaproteobacteria bacterium]
MHLAALLTCHNRRDQTLACLRALHACSLPSDCELSVYLVDDGSSDGTETAVRAEFPLVNVIDGDGSLFWNGGMRRAFGVAMQQDHDFYLWLNDDTILYPEALQRVFVCSDEMASAHGGRRDVIVGATCDAVSGQLTYGGLVSRSRWSPNTLVHLPEADHPQSCQTLNGNCVLIPQQVVQAIGNIDDAFVHAIGDWDYGFRARRAGFGIWMVPGFVGTCSSNQPAVTLPAEAANIRLQLRKTCGPKRVPPHAWRVYVQRNCGLFWPAYFVRPYVSAVLRAFAAKFRRARG